jgi:hypothetical protein
MNTNMENHVFGHLEKDGIHIVRRNGKLYVRYDAGSHLVQWREDEITDEEAARITEDGRNCNDALLALQRRLIANGKDPYVSNWNPSEKPNLDTES